MRESEELKVGEVGEGGGDEAVDVVRDEKEVGEVAKGVVGEARGSACGGHRGRGRQRGHRSRGG